MTKMVQPDPMWDSEDADNGVICSSVGEDAKKYHDLSTQFTSLGGRPVAALLPGGGKRLRGVIIPRSNENGVSLGHDSNKPGIITIDPDIKGQSVTVDLAKITPDAVAEALRAAKENPACGSSTLVAAQTFFNLAERTGTTEDETSLDVDGEVIEERLPPLPAMGGYVAPKATIGGGQMKPLPQPRPQQKRVQVPIVKREKVAAVQTPVPEDVSQDELNADVATIPIQPTTLRYDAAIAVQRPLTVKNTVSPIRPTAQVATKQAAAAKLATVEFEMPGWGTFVASYHSVIQNDCLLVLVFDNRYNGSTMKYFPPSSEHLISLRVAGDKRIFFVHSHDSRFTHDHCEYCVLLIDQVAQDE